jgi:HK97 gp10 family phage protein
MITTSVKLENSRWAEVEQKIQASLAVAVADMAGEVETWAKALCPVGPDRENHTHMRDTIAAEKVSDLDWSVTVGADYAQFVELGTTRMAPRPFLIPAVNHVRARFFARVAAAIRSALK